MKTALVLPIVLFLIGCTNALADDRYCWDVPIRDMRDGSIYRDMSVVAEFKRTHPCPSTWKKVGSCPGWAVDHVIPLAVGGCDTIENMQWLPNEIKSCSSDVCKDRWERKIYQREW